jgi:carboxymethylenebutenolidase
MGKMVEFDTSGGKTAGYLAVPETGQGPGILLCHAWWGLNDFFRSLADRLAGEGYAVLAPDLFDGRVASTIPEAEVQIQGVEADGGRKAASRVTGALDHLLGLGAAVGPSVAAIGFSMGAAYVSLLSTQRSEIGAVTLFYGGVFTGSRPGKYPELTRAALQAHLAPHDEWEPEEPMREVEADMMAAGRPMELYFYPGTRHWFMETDRPEYDPEAARLAWERTLGFLERQLSASRAPAS